MPAQSQNNPLRKYYMRVIVGIGVVLSCVLGAIYIEWRLVDFTHNNNRYSIANYCHCIAEIGSQFECCVFTKARDFLNLISLSMSQWPKVLFDLCFLFVCFFRDGYLLFLVIAECVMVSFCCCVWYSYCKHNDHYIDPLANQVPEQEHQGNILIQNSSSILY